MLGRGAGSPPPGVFRLLQIALACCRGNGSEAPFQLGDGLARFLPGFLEDMAGSVDSYQCTVATEALEALLAVRPEWVSASRWLPVFRRAFTDGLRDFNLAKHALRELERWRDTGAALDWAALLPCMGAYLRAKHVSGEEQSTTQARVPRSNAERRAQRNLLTRDAEDRDVFLRRLLSFVGSLGGGCHALVAPEPNYVELRRPTAAIGIRVPLTLGTAAIDLEVSLVLPHLTRLVRWSRDRGARR